MSTEGRDAVLISGASGYLGSAIVLALQNAGYTHIALRADVTDETAMEKEAQEMQEKSAKLTGIIHAASPGLVRAPLLSQSKEDFESQFSVNVRGAFNLFKYFSPFVIEGGALVGITSLSVDDKKSYAPTGSYIAAKYALRGILRVLSHELMKQNIRVYAVAPAFMPGGLNEDIPETVRNIILTKSVPEATTTPEVVARVVVTLILNTNSVASGSSIAVPSQNITPL